MNCVKLFLPPSLLQILPPGVTLSMLFKMKFEPFTIIEFKSIETELKTKKLIFFSFLDSLLQKHFFPVQEKELINYIENKEYFSFQKFLFKNQLKQMHCFVLNQLFIGMIVYMNTHCDIHTHTPLQEQSTFDILENFILKMKN